MERALRVDPGEHSPDDQANSPRPCVDTPGFNRSLAAGPAEVDSINAAFYGCIQFPPAPLMFERVLEAGFWSRMLSQDIGSWSDPVIAEGSRIWVAGCGRNQALVTALKFPEATVLGTDLSEPSLDT